MYAARAALEAREQRRLTLEDLASRVATAQGLKVVYAPTVVRRWLEGMTEPASIDTWYALATALRVSAGWLAFGEGTMWGAAAPATPRTIGEDPYEDGIESEAAVSSREAAPRPALRVAEGRPGRATGGSGRSSAAPSRGKRPKR